jgi:hypothetical protein
MSKNQKAAVSLILDLCNDTFEATQVILGGMGEQLRKTGS